MIKKPILSAILLLFLAWPAAGDDGVWLGVWLGDLLDGGAQVVALASGGPAHRGGLRVGDIIVEADGVPISVQAVLGNLLEQRESGQPVKLSLLRSGAELVVEVVPEKRPDAPEWSLIAPRAKPAPRPPEVAELLRNRLQSARQGLIEGIQVAEITPGLREHYGAPADAGVLVLGVGTGEESATLGLKVGDVLVRLAGRDIRDQRQLERALTTWPGNRPLEVRIVRVGENRTFVVESSAGEGETEGGGRFGLASAHAEREFLAQRLEREIERLKRRMEELQRQLDGLRDDD